MDWRTLGLQVGVPVLLLLSLVVVRYLDRDEPSLGRRIRSRLLMGIPWGTLVSIGLVLSVYLVLQRGFWSPHDPLTLPFTSWSYFYPLGVLTAPFAHQSLGHLTGNLIGFAALGTIAEYAFSHFPTGRGSHSFGSWRTNPFVRAFLLFPAGVVFVGLGTSVFAWGPIIGFSGVVFAAVGFAVVRYPLFTVVALLGREFLGVIIASIREPIITATASPSFGPPWWVGIAIQGHLLGFLLGVLLGALVLTRRRTSERPSATRLWAGTVIAGSGLTLWAVWWYRGPSRFVLHRGLGLILLLLLATLVAGAIRSGEGELLSGIRRREVAVALLALPILTMGFVAVPVNLTSVGDQPVPGEPIGVRGYTVTYAENVPNQKTRAINLSVFGETTRVNASGVIVVNPERGIWTERVSAGRLAHSGRATVKLGGLFWSRTVHIRRRGWTVVGGGTAYRVTVIDPDPHENRSGTFVSEPVTASPVLAGRNVSIAAGPESFRLNVSRAGRQLATGPIPPMNESVTLGGIRFIRRKEGLIATLNDSRTRIRIAKPESYD